MNNAIFIEDVTHELDNPGEEISHSVVWTGPKMIGELPAARGGLTATYVDGRIFVFGGTRYVTGKSIL
jgi:hypothetical protein